jgi:Ca2+:H+ antiporter
MNGNIALSMEIGSAYALQVLLLQIPALVLFSAFHGQFIDVSHLESYTFNLIFPQWDMITAILCVVLLSYVYGEGKVRPMLLFRYGYQAAELMHPQSNYFKGSILCLTYLVIVIGFWQAGVGNTMEHEGIDRFEVMGNGRTFKTVGMSSSGQAW